MKKIIIALTLIVAFLIYNNIKEDTIVIPSTAIRLRVIPNSNSSQDQYIKGKDSVSFKQILTESRINYSP